MKHLLWGSVFFFSAAVSASSYPHQFLSNFKEGETWITLEKDLLVHPEQTELIFYEGSVSNAPHFKKMVPPNHCKVTLQASSKAFRRVEASPKSALPVTKVTFVTEKYRSYSIRFDLKAATLASIECTNTSYGHSISSLYQPSEPSKEDFYFHLGPAFSIRAGKTDAQDIVAP